MFPIDSLLFIFSPTKRPHGVSSILKEQVLESGENGHVKFDEKGDRLNSDYDIFNIQRVSGLSNSYMEVTILVILFLSHKPVIYIYSQFNWILISLKDKESYLVKVGEYMYSEYDMEMELKINLNAVLWPGGATEKPLGFVIPKHLRVGLFIFATLGVSYRP